MNEECSFLGHGWIILVISIFLFNSLYSKFKPTIYGIKIKMIIFLNIQVINTLFSLSINFCF